MPRTSKIANGQDVTKSFNVVNCAWGPCKVSGGLTLGPELTTGWNHLIATVHTDSGAVGSSRLRFYEKTSLTDPTNGSVAPYAVHVKMTASQGIEVGYSLATGNAPIFYQAESPCSGLTVLDLDRSTLAFKSITCYGTTLTEAGALDQFWGTLTQNDLILASTPPGVSLGQLDLSPVGGTNFISFGPYAPPPPPPAFGYSIIGYGKAGAGTATESYNSSSDAPWYGIEGNLINVGSSTPLYAFQSTDSAGFAVVPNGLSATVTIGNPQQLPLAGGTPPNRTVPAGFTNVTYSAPPVTGSGGGLWVLVLDRHSLQLVSSNTYSSRLNDNSLNQSQTSDLVNNIYHLDNAKLVFIVTLVGPDTSGDYGSTPLNTQLNQGNQYTNILQTVMQMGISPFAFDKIMGLQWGLHNPASAFSMIGIPKNFMTELPTKVPNTCTIPSNTTTVCGGNQDQWFSSALDTQQHETGALKGSLVRNKAFEYSPTSVGSIDANTLSNNPTPDTLLSDTIARGVSTAPSVPWPLHDTPGHQAAYASLSNQMVSSIFFPEQGCGTASYCSDIRFYYTGDEANQIANSNFALPCPSDTAPPSAVSPAYPGDGNGFSSQEWTDAVCQLKLEKAYLSDVIAYQNWMKDINTDANQNLGIQLSAAALQVANDLNQATGQPQEGIKNDPLSLSANVLSEASTVAGAFSELAPPLGVISSILGGAAGILSIVDGTQGASPTPDPYVNQLGDLIAANEGTASDAANKFNTDLATSMTTFFNGVYSDWFKLQSIALMSVNPDAPPWYGENQNSVASFAPYLAASARKSFYMQLASRYFCTQYLETSGYAPRFPGYGSIPSPFAMPDDLTSQVVSYFGVSKADYAVNYRDTLPYYDIDGNLYADGTWNYNVVVLQNNHSATWSSDFGDILMGPANSSDGTGNLNLNPDVLYDSGIFPTISFIINNF